MDTTGQQYYGLYRLLGTSRLLYDYEEKYDDKMGDTAIEKEIAKMCAVDIYEHSVHKRANIPNTGDACYDRVKKEMVQVDL